MTPSDARDVLRSMVGGRNTFHAVYPPDLASAWFQPLSLRNEKLVSEFAFPKFNLYRLHHGGARPSRQRHPVRVDARGGAAHAESS
jgi:hypothetical protein